MKNMLIKADFKSWGVIFLLTGFVALMFWKGFKKTPTIAPDLTFTTITGKQIRLSALQGKPALINFWATSCPSCIEEIPTLTTLYNRFHPQGVEMIAIAMAYDPPNRVVNLAKTQQLPYDVVLDIKGEYAKAFGGIWAIPTTLVIAPDRKIIKQELGLFDLGTMERRIERLLKG